jgi:tRNA dimethylallyltransferase
LRAELETLPLSDLLLELAERDPATYASIDRQNPRRVVRAVEVIRLTGRPFSEQRAQWEQAGGSPGPSGHEFGLQRSAADLQSRIDRRADLMFSRGLVAETEALLKRGLAENRTAMQALGYRQVAEHLRGERSLAETIALVKTRTRQFARRQMTWFRRQARLQWITVGPQDGPDAVAETIENGAYN